MDLALLFAAVVYSVLDRLGFTGIDTTILAILVILVIIGLVIIVLVKFFLILIPAILVAILVYFLTGGNMLWTGIAFLVVALLSLLRKI
ncbi:MAG: hypothetical protein LBI79_05270 [Nitrososphaerota archaeon]|nr:hypothetical protein [Nitrososphaerota archaeon]